jgi:acylphosphatase
MMICRVHAVIQGKVQGVYFRASTLEKAQSLEIRGYVKNLHDGTVELDAESNKEKLIELLQWCHKGPPGASVESIETTWLENLKHYTDFTIR